MQRKIYLSLVSFLTFILAFPAIAQQKKPAAPKTVATVEGNAITQKELNEAAAGDLERLELQKARIDAQAVQARQEILERNLNRLINDRLLTKEAAKRGITKEQLIANEVTSKVQDPTQAEIDFYYETNKARINAPKEQVTGQIAQYLRQQNQSRLMDLLIESLKKQYPVTTNLEPLRYQLDTKGHPSLGPETAPVTLVEFSDFQCSYCKSYAAVLKRVVADFKGSVRLVYRNYPNTETHPESLSAAQASLCAQEQGRFWEMHDILFQNSDKLKDEDLKVYASKLGLNMKLFSDCLDGRKHADKLKRDFLDATRAGVTGTPTLFVNGRPFVGDRTFEELSRIVHEELSNPSSRNR